jgi:hypothetical protein
MANNPTPTWKAPRQGDLPTKMHEVIRSLQNFLGRPDFYNGLTLGDGTAPTKDIEGVVTEPTTREWNLTTYEDLISTLGGLALVVWDMPNGMLKRTPLTANFGSIGTTPIAVPELTTTYTAEEGRVIEYEAKIQMSCTDTAAYGIVQIHQDGLLVGGGPMPMSTVNTLQVTAPVLPASGAHTIEVRVAVSSGVGTVIAQTTNPCHLVIRDAGAA